jgi:anaerobic selenocysteine-containing dehydrogenase
VSSSTFRPTPPTTRDIVLPATTQLEHLDIHRSYGHTYAMLNTPPFNRSAKASRTPKSFGCLRSGWVLMSRTSRTPTKNWSVRR